MRRAALLVLPALLLAGCAAASQAPAQTDALTIENRYPLEYAKQFTVDVCAGGYDLITIDGSRYLVVPEGAAAPADLDADITVLQQPIQNIYLVSSSAMDPIISIGGLGAVALSGTQAENWYLDAARTAGHAITTAYGDRMGSIDFALASSVAQEVIHGYETLALDEVWLVHGEFMSMGHQPPKSLRLLPLQTPQAAEDEEQAGEARCEYVYEPQEEQLLAELLPRYVKVQVYRGLLDTSASEHAARMAAMDNATRNCNELINSLTLLYNKTRQASITSELIDIVGGAEALNG